MAIVTPGTQRECGRRMARMRMTAAFCRSPTNGLRRNNRRVCNDRL